MWLGDHTRRRSPYCTARSPKGGNRSSKTTVSFFIVQCFSDSKKQWQNHPTPQNLWITWGLQGPFSILFLRFRAKSRENWRWSGFGFRQWSHNATLPHPWSSPWNPTISPSRKWSYWLSSSIVIIPEISRNQMYHWRVLLRRCCTLWPCAGHEDFARKQSTAASTAQRCRCAWDATSVRSTQKVWLKGETHT